MCGERGDPIHAFGGGFAVSPEDYDGVKVKWIVFAASD